MRRQVGNARKFYSLQAIMTSTCQLRTVQNEITILTRHIRGNYDSSHKSTLTRNDSHGGLTVTRESRQTIQATEALHENTLQTDAFDFIGIRDAKDRKIPFHFHRLDSKQETRQTTPALQFGLQRRSERYCNGCMITLLGKDLVRAAAEEPMIISSSLKHMAASSLKVKQQDIRIHSISMFITNNTHTLPITQHTLHIHNTNIHSQQHLQQTTHSQEIVWRRLLRRNRASIRFRCLEYLTYHTLQYNSTLNSYLKFSSTSIIDATLPQR